MKHSDKESNNKYGSIIYDNETATNYFNDFLSAYNFYPDYNRVYQEYGRIFSKLLFDSTSKVEIKFSGNFSRTSYLLRENDATPYECRIVNDARVRLRNSSLISSDEKQRYAVHDFKALQTFVSIIYHVTVPDEISRLFLDDEKLQDPQVHSSTYFRVIVDSFDDSFITGHIDAEGSPVIRISYKGGIYNYDYSYLRNYLNVGTQLNVINPSDNGDHYTADFIILEPDLLVDVTSIASCFQDYGTTPLVSILNKFKKVNSTTAIELGNLAGQFLDEEVNHKPSQNTFAQSIKDYYEHNALSLITSGIESEATDFLDKARLQKKHIRDAVRSILPKAVGKFKPENIILEPSFISEMLGLQGRMDFLQLDKKVVIEQKSGRCGFPQHTPDTPVAKLQHYIQVLLYMLVLRYNFNKEYKQNGGIQAFLMYSQYSNSLLALDFAPSLIEQAVKVRNMLVAAEYNCAREGFQFLDRISPDDLLLNSTKSKFFHTYIEPSLKSILLPIQTASPLERSYFYRFLKFVAEEQILSKVGNKTKANTGFSSAWNDSLDEKLQAGNIYSDLILGEIPETEDKIESVTLFFQNNDDNDMSNFRKGDIVMLYPYSQGTEPDARRTIIFRCSISEIMVDRLVLQLRAPQSDANVFLYHNYYRWAVEHDFMDSSYSPLYRGLHSLLTTNAERRSLILGQRIPSINKNKSLNGEYGAFNDLMLKVKQADDLFLILGPPGSGKTSFGLLNTLKEQLSEEGTSVLLLSYTNRAVDEICSKLVQSGLDFIRIGSKLSCSEEYHKYLISERVKQYPRLTDMRKMLQGMRVYTGTVTALNGSISLLKLKTFDLAIIDEASQILEPHLMPLLCDTNDTDCAIRKIVMIGDYKQLPAVVQQSNDESVVTSEDLNGIGVTDCRNSLFQRFYETYSDNDDVCFMLTKQGRMHADIAAFSNFSFYEDKLEVVPLKHQKANLPSTCNSNDGIDDILTTRRISFICSEPPSDQLADKINQNEADIIAALVYHIYILNKKDFNSSETVGVIVPYRNQISTIRNTLTKKYNIDELQDITIDTVERFQGSQRTYIIYGFTISKYYQLNFLTSTNFIDSNGIEIDRKLNVALTRAMKYMIIVGNPYLLSNNFTYSNLIKFIKNHNGYFDIPLQKFLDGNFFVSPSDTTAIDFSQVTYTLSRIYSDAFTKHVLSKTSEYDNTFMCYHNIRLSQYRLTSDKYDNSSANIYALYNSRIYYSIASRTHSDVLPLLSNIKDVIYIDFTFRTGECSFSFIEKFNSPSNIISVMSSPFINNIGIEIISDISSVPVELYDDRLPDFINGKTYMLNMTDFFSECPASKSELLASSIVRAIKTYRDSKFFILIQSPETDRQLNSYNVFKSVIHSCTSLLSSRDLSFSYHSSGVSYEYPFVYELFTSV